VPTKPVERNEDHVVRLLSGFGVRPVVDVNDRQRRIRNCLLALTVDRGEGKTEREEKSGKAGTAQRAQSHQQHPRISLSHRAGLAWALGTSWSAICLRRCCNAPEVRCSNCRLLEPQALLC